MRCVLCAGQPASLQLRDEDASALARTKTVHVYFIVMAVLASVLSRQNGPSLLQLVPFSIGGALEVLDPAFPSKGRWARIAEVAMASLLGSVGTIMLFLFAIDEFRLFG